MDLLESFDILKRILLSPPIIVGYAVLLLVFAIVKAINAKPKPKSTGMPSSKVKFNLALPKNLPKIGKAKATPEEEEEDLV